MGVSHSLDWQFQYVEEGKKTVMFLVDTATGEENSELRDRDSGIGIMQKI